MGLGHGFDSDQNPMLLISIMSVRLFLQFSISTIMEIVVADGEEEAAGATRAGRPRSSWSYVCTENLPEPATLRKAAQKWLNNHKVIHTTLTASSKNREPALIARCGKCVDCTHQHCFSWSLPLVSREWRNGNYCSTITTILPFPTNQR